MHTATMPNASHKPTHAHRSTMEPMDKRSSGDDGAGCCTKSLSTRVVIFSPTSSSVPIVCAQETDHFLVHKAEQEPVVNLVTLGKRAREEAEETLVVLPPVEKKRRTDSDSLLSIKKELVARVDATKDSPARLVLPYRLDIQSVK